MVLQLLGHPNPFTVIVLENEKKMILQSSVVSKLGKMANSAYFHKTALRISLIRVYTCCYVNTVTIRVVQVILFARTQFY